MKKVKRDALRAPGAGCEWPDGCNRGGFRAVSMPEHGERFLCLHHAGRVWNARKAANRAAGLCACGANPTPGFRTCARCREWATAERGWQRRMRQIRAEHEAGTAPMVLSAAACERRHRPIIRYWRLRRQRIEADRAERERRREAV